MFNKLKETKETRRETAGTFDSVRIESAESGCMELLDSECQGALSSSTKQIINTGNSEEGDTNNELNKPVSSFIDTDKVESVDLSEEGDAVTPQFLTPIPSLEIMRATTKQFMKGDSTDRAINSILSAIASNTFIGKTYSEIKELEKELSK